MPDLAPSACRGPINTRQHPNVAPHTPPTHPQICTPSTWPPRATSPAHPISMAATAGADTPDARRGRRPRATRLCPQRRHPYRDQSRHSPRKPPPPPSPLPTRTHRLEKSPAAAHFVPHNCRHRRRRCAAAAAPPPFSPPPRPPPPRPAQRRSKPFQRWGMNSLIERCPCSSSLLPADCTKADALQLAP
jgi:hypothetical protein